LAERGNPAWIGKNLLKSLDVGIVERGDLAAAGRML